MLRNFHCLVPLIYALVVVGSASEAEENASNPLAAVNNTDIRYQYFDLAGGADRQDAFVDGAYMCGQSCLSCRCCQSQQTDPIRTLTATRGAGTKRERASKCA